MEPDTRPSPHAPAPLPAPLRQIRGDVRVDAASREACARDFGNCYEGLPAAIVQPADERDVALALSVAREGVAPVVVRGAGHSCHGQTVCEASVILRAPEHEVIWRDDERVELPAGARWRAVEAALNRRARAAPVLPNYLDLSVGGTLSVGGYGVAAVARGALVHNVDAIRLVTPDGRTRWCSPSQHGELFGAARGGASQPARVRAQGTPLRGP